MFDLETWLEAVPPQHDLWEPNPLVCEDHNQIEAQFGYSSLLIVEGVRGCGKSYLVKALSEALEMPTYSTWASQGGRKDRYAQKGSAKPGAADLEDQDLDIAQAGLFVLEALLQLRTRVILDRSYLTSMYFQNSVSPARWRFFIETLKALDGLVLFVDTPLEVCAERRGVSPADLAEEHRLYREVLRRVPKRLLRVLTVPEDLL